MVEVFDLRKYSHISSIFKIKVGLFFRQGCHWLIFCKAEFSTSRELLISKKKKKKKKKIEKSEVSWAKNFYVEKLDHLVNCLKYKLKITINPKQILEEHQTKVTSNLKFGNLNLPFFHTFWVASIWENSSLPTPYNLNLN